MENAIIEYLEDKFSAISKKDIKEHVERIMNSNNEYFNDDSFYNVFNDLIDKKILYKSSSGNYLLSQNSSHYRKGVLDLNVGGFGFVRIGNGQKDVHVAYNKINGAVNGDTVLIELIKEETPDSRAEGEIVQILSHDDKNLVGELKRKKNSLYFEPSDEKFKNKLFLNNLSLKGRVEGEIISVKKLGKTTKDGKIIVEYDKTIGHKDDPDVDIKIIAAENNIYFAFNEASIMQSETTPNDVSEDEITGRLDLRDKMIFTIDGADTKDIDDAISLDVLSDHYVLGVHIADVTHYVSEGSPLDNEALERGNSAYLADTVIPMLPHKLSNGICSLNEGVDRLAMSCIMNIDFRGNLIDAEVRESVINSKKKMTYDNVNQILEDGVIPEGYEEFASTLLEMNKLAHILRGVRDKRGQMEFQTQEAKVYCDKDGVPIKIAVREQREGEKLIEDFMIAANEAVTFDFAKKGLAYIYRVHDVPSEERIQDFKNLCEMLGYPIIGKFKDISSAMFQKMLSQLDDAPEGLKKVLHAKAIRSMAKAKYSKDNIGHFGLASTSYTHFTSPIRRYSDDIAHRLLKIYMDPNKSEAEKIKESNRYNSVLTEWTDHISETEVNAQNAERDVNKLKMAQYMENHIGEEYKVMITGFVGSGMFVQTEELVEGLIPFEKIEGDYYNVDESLNFAVGEQSGNVFKLGDQFIAKCTNASKEKKQIDFAFVRTLDE